LLAAPHGGFEAAAQMLAWFDVTWVGLTDRRRRFLLAHTGRRCLIGVSRWRVEWGSLASGCGAGFPIWPTDPRGQAPTDQ
jgi:hypothetical protein